MIDDYKYSIGRVVVYRHPCPACPESEYGRFGPERTLGIVRSVEQVRGQAHVWAYAVENTRTGEKARVPETDIHYAIFGRELRRAGKAKDEAEQLAKELARSHTDIEFPSYLSIGVRDLVSREQSDERARKHGRELPLEQGDYVRIRGDLRPEMGPHHNHYAKILAVGDPDIAAIESRDAVYKVRQKYLVRLDDGAECVVYDPEIKLYYTADGRTTILNWRAATFLAESFHDDPPYRVDYSYLEDHVFTRDELDAMSSERLAHLFAEILYVKGRMGLRDLEAARRRLAGVPREHLVDALLAISRFDMRRNRSLTPVEVELKRKDAFKLRRILRGR